MAAIPTTWLLHRTQYGRRLSEIPLATAVALVASGDAKKRWNLYVAKVQLAPIAVTVPVITGTPAVGSTLTCSDGTWIGKPPPVITKQWTAAGVNIAGATGNTYVVVAGDAGKTISCKVTGTNSQGSVTGAVVGVAIPAALEDPELLDGDGSENDPDPDAPPAPPPGDDEEETELNENLTDPTVQEPTDPPTHEDDLYKPANVVLPSIGGVAQVGETLICDPGEWDGKPLPTMSYQWKVDSVPVMNATEYTFVVDTQDVDGVITCTVVAANSEGSSQRTTPATAPVIA